LLVAGGFPEIFGLTLAGGWTKISAEIFMNMYLLASVAPLPVVRFGRSVAIIIGNTPGA